MSLELDDRRGRARNSTDRSTMNSSMSWLLEELSELEELDELDEMLELLDEDGLDELLLEPCSNCWTTATMSSTC
jgi:uncharacterized protein YidB (DUF937 family)